MKVLAPVPHLILCVVWQVGDWLTVTNIEEGKGDDVYIVMGSNSGIETGRVIKSADKPKFDLAGVLFTSVQAVQQIFKHANVRIASNTGSQLRFTIYSNCMKAK